MGKQYIIDFGTGAGNDEADTLEEAMKIAEEGLTYTLQPVTIYSDGAEVALLPWFGIEPEEGLTVERINAILWLTAVLPCRSENGARIEIRNKILSKKSTAKTAMLFLLLLSGTYCKMYLVRNYRLLSDRDPFDTAGLPHHIHCRSCRQSPSDHSP